MASIPALEVGGTHVTAALVDPTTWALVGPRHRQSVDAAGPAAEIIAAWVAAAGASAAPSGARWGVAMPDPFDYPRGIARFEGVGKFEALFGLDVGAALRGSIAPPPESVAFVNDADAFILGEWLVGAARGTRRCVGLTLGTGVGSGWIADGSIVSAGPAVPPGGRAHRITLDGRPLEDVMSRRAIRAAYAAATDDAQADVREIAGRARAGDAVAIEVLRVATSGLGRALGPYLARFDPDVIVVGGSMAASWDVLSPGFLAAVTTAPTVRRSIDAEAAGLAGAAWFSSRR